MNLAVIDLGFGDSGKGMVTAFLCQLLNNPIVVRYSGGPQAGHTVVHNGIRHVFSSFGSGTLQGIPTYWSEACTFNPNNFMGELGVLKKNHIRPEIFVNSNCPITTFADITYNRNRNDINQHGSCGAGVGTTLEREEHYYSLTVGDLLFPSVLETKLKMILENYYSDIEYEKKDVDNFIEDCYEAFGHIRIVKDDSITNDFYHKIYESSQGLLLDKDIGFFPHVTRGNVGSKAIKDDIEIVYYVTRAYQTRHGNGPMTNEVYPHQILENENETNVKNYQGIFRRHILDLDLLEYSIYKDNTKAPVKRLVITCMDQVRNDLRFTYRGNVVKSKNEEDFITSVANILGFEEVYASYSDDYSKIRYTNKNVNR